MMKVESDLLHQATTKELSLDEYKQIFVFLSNNSINSLIEILTVTDIIKILSFLDFYDEDTYEVSKDITRILLNLFPHNFAYSSSDVLLSIVSAENYFLSTMIFQELTHRITNNSNGQFEPINLTREFVQLILELVFQEDLDLSYASQTLLINYCKQSREICRESFQSVIQPKLAKISTNSVHLFRYFDVVLEIGMGTMDKELFSLVIDKNVMAIWAAIIAKDDLLEHMNVLELIRKLVGHQLGYEMLTCSGVLHGLCMRLLDISKDGFSSIMLPSYLAVFVELCKRYSVEALKSYGAFMNVLNDNVGIGDLSSQLQTLEILTTIVAIPDCKLIIAAEYDLIVSKSLQILANLFDRSITEYRIRSGHALAMILTVPLNHAHYTQLCSINEKWFFGIESHHKIIASIFSLVKLPTEDLKLTGLTLAAAISSQGWGIRVICGHGELVDFLLQRSDVWKSCIDTKWDLITNLVHVFEVNQAPRLCSETVMNKIRQYHKDGKYYAPYNPEVLVDIDI